MTMALRPAAVTSSAVSASPSAVRAMRATSAPACASATAIARPIPRDAPVTKAVLPVRSNRLTIIPFIRWPAAGRGPLFGKRPGRGIQLPHYLIQHDADVSLPDPKVLRVRCRDQLSLRNAGESGPGLIRAQVVVELGHQDDQRASTRRPGVQIGVGCAAQRGR